MICYVTACTMQHTENKTKQQPKKKENNTNEIVQSSTGP